VLYFCNLRQDFFVFRQSSGAQDEADEADTLEANDSKPDAQASISGSETDKRNEEVSSSSTRENDESQPEKKDTKDKSASRGKRDCDNFGEGPSRGREPLCRTSSGSFSSSGGPISKKLKIGDPEGDSSESKNYRSISPPSLISEGLTDSSSSDIESVLQVKITLKNITPKVWRRLLVNSNFTFEDLNFIIQEAFGWTVGNVHIFRTFDSLLLVEDKMYHVFQLARRYTGLNVQKEDHVCVGEYLHSPGDEVVYLFGVDCWEHQVFLEQRLKLSCFAIHRRCIDGRRACPPDGCGGAAKYQEIIEILDNPTHEEFDKTRKDLEEMSPGFDPDKFDKYKVARR
jgi:hypothetical protein